MRLPDWGRKRMFPTAPLRAALELKAKQQTLKEGDAHLKVGRAFNGAEKTGLMGFCRERGIPQRKLYCPAINEYLVDDICCAAGIHPSEVYEDWHSLADAVLEAPAGRDNKLPGSGSSRPAVLPKRGAA